jgi:hypothetical protein
MSLLSSLRFGAAAVILAGAVQAQVVFEESMTNWAHAGTTGWTDDFTVVGSKGTKVDRLDSTTVLNYTRAIATLKKGHYVATIRIQKFKSTTGTAPLTFEVLGSNGGKAITIPFSQTHEKDKLLNKWMWIQTVVFTVPVDNASMVFRLSNLDAKVVKQDYYFDWFKVGRIPEGKAMTYQSQDFAYAPWSLANQGGTSWYKDHVAEKTSAFGEVAEVTGNNWLEHRSFYGWNSTQPKHDMILQPGTYTYNWRVFAPTSGQWAFTLHHATVAGTTASWKKRDWTIAEQTAGAWQLTPNISFVVTKANTPVRFIFKNTSSGGKFGYKFDAFMLRKGAFDVTGTACKSSLGDVRINGNIPQIGEPFSVSVNNSPIAAVFMIGATTLSVDLTSAGMTGCTLYTAPVLNFASVSTANVSSLTFPIPVNASLIGVKFREQALVLDPKANKFGAALSTVGSAVIQN